MVTPRNDWLQLTIEDTIDPDLPICDPHHHLWERPGNDYMLDDLLRDLTSGHNIVSTVFLECSSMYRTDGPEHMKPLGETEFVAAVADEAAARPDVHTNINAGIASHADLTLGEPVAEVLEAHIELGKGRFRGIRHGTSHDPQPRNPRIPRPGTRRDDDAQVPRRVRAARQARPQLRRMAVSPATARTRRPRALIPGHHNHPRPHRRAPRRRPLRRQARRDYGNLEAQHRRSRAERECLREGRRLRHAQLRQWLARARHAAQLRRACRSHRALLPLCHRAVRRRALHVREQLPCRQGRPTPTMSCGTHSSASSPTSPTAKKPPSSTTRQQGRIASSKPTGMAGLSAPPSLSFMCYISLRRGWITWTL